MGPEIRTYCVISIRKKRLRLSTQKANLGLAFLTFGGSHEATAELLNGILDEVRPLIGKGKVADYIPALAEVPAEKLGIAVCYNDGEIIQAGDANEPFSIQSISKVLSLTLACQIYQPEEIWERR